MTRKLRFFALSCLLAALLPACSKPNAEQDESSEPYRVTTGPTSTAAPLPTAGAARLPNPRS